MTRPHLKESNHREISLSMKENVQQREIFTLKELEIREIKHKRCYEGRISNKTNEKK